jgi:phage repressor protein C with HTH and peptisase S24 domain
MKTIHSRIKQARINSGLTQAQLAERLGVSPQSVQQWESSTAPRRNRLVVLCSVLGVDPDWVLFGRERHSSDADHNLMQKENNISVAKPTLADTSFAIQNNTVDKYSVESLNDGVKKVYRVDILDITASAGAGFIAQSEAVEIISSIEYTADAGLSMFGGRPESSIKLINVNGDSMEGTINPGDLIFIDVSINQFVGDGIYVFSFDDKIHVKRLQLVKDKLMVISDNSKYVVWEITEEDEGRFHVSGKVLLSQTQQLRRHS